MLGTSKEGQCHFIHSLYILQPLTKVCANYTKLGILQAMKLQTVRCGLMTEQQQQHGLGFSETWRASVGRHTSLS